MEWTDEQLLVIIESACAADGGTYSSIQEVLKAFIDMTSYSLLDRLEDLYPQCELAHDSTWSDIAPQWHIWERPRPEDEKYLYGKAP